MDGCVVMRAVPWWNPRAYLNPAVIIATIVIVGCAVIWFSTPVNTQMPWWMLIVALMLGGYWPVDRAITQARARRQLPLLIREALNEVEIHGERRPKRSITSIEHVRVQYGKSGDEFGPIVYHEIHAIVEEMGEHRRFVLVEEGMNSAKIARVLAERIGCPVSTTDVRGPER